MKLPSPLIEAARARVQECTHDRQHSLDAIARGCPVQAERVKERKVGRITKVLGISAEQAKTIDSFQAPQRPARTKRGGAEIVQGDTEDFLGVAFLETALAAAGCVARVAFRDHRPQGSGFMVSEHLFLTNHHVIETTTACAQFMLEFDYQLDHRGQPRTVTRFALAPEVFFLTSPETELDFTLVAVGKRIAGRNDLDAYGYVPLLNRGDKHMLGELVNLIQHPEGNFKQAVIRENQLVARLPTVLHYVADTMPGSSGSPVFNDQWEVVALHHWGEPFTETLGKGGKKVRHDVNEGIRVSAILKRLAQWRGPLGGGRARGLLDAVLEPKLEYPSRLGETMTPTPRPRNAPFASVDGTLAHLEDDGTATWILPLRVSVNLGHMPGAAPVAPPVVREPEPAADGTAEKVEIDTHYCNRSGYNPNFLPGFVVPMPKLTVAQRKLAAKVINPPAGANPLELKYTHFSLMMNARRRMAFFTACNIDGKTWVNIDRKAGESGEGAEASETWFEDIRLDPAAQCEQKLYDQKVPRVFDRGHLVRRQDPAWGTQARAVRANADTFHFTNCTPQAVSFNERARYWQGIERYILEDNAVADQEKVTVFTGPVLDETHDVPWRDVKVPRKFWKLVVRVQDGKLAVLAMIADQSGFLKSLPESFSAEAMEAWDNTAKVNQYLSTVREVERLTKLNFGVLRQHDVRSGGEAAGGLVTSFADIPLEPPKGRARRR